MRVGVLTSYLTCHHPMSLRRRLVSALHCRKLLASGARVARLGFAPSGRSDGSVN